MNLPPLLTLYRFASALAEPLAPVWLRNRVRRGKEHPDRFGERLGAPSLPRPGGGLVWLHGASVGEALSLLSIIDALNAERPDLHILVTTGTVTSARVLAPLLPRNSMHQFAPIDGPRAVKAFLAHWQPDAAIFAESEIWPNLIAETARLGTPMALVNARLSDHSLSRWSRAASTARWLFACFDVVIAADNRTAEGLGGLLDKMIAAPGNLKQAASRLDADPDQARLFYRLFEVRRTWLAASTHEGEEQMLIEAHAEALADYPDALLVLAPRHPERAAEIIPLLEQRKMGFARRSLGELPTREHAVFLADTIGEIPLWLQAVEFAFVGGSLVSKIGGHNPIEPALASRAIISGPHVQNFIETYATLEEGSGVVFVDSAESLAEAVSALFSNPGQTAIIGEQAKAAVEARAQEILQFVMDEVRPLLPHGPLAG